MPPPLLRILQETEAVTLRMIFGVSRRSSDFSRAGRYSSRARDSSILSRAARRSSCMEDSGILSRVSNGRISS
ncbi:MAG: hypothetical protein PUC98_04015 [Clostridiales bacterium]|nr:hypothetical protein [Clostridiales bacterium]